MTDFDVEQELPERQLFRRLCKDIIKYKEKDLIERPKKWGDINFKEIETEIETIFWLVEKIDDTLPLDILPNNFFFFEGDQQAREALNDLDRLLKEGGLYQNPRSIKPQLDKIRDQIEALLKDASYFLDDTSRLRIKVPLLALDTLIDILDAPYQRDRIKRFIPDAIKLRLNNIKADIEALIKGANYFLRNIEEAFKQLDTFSLSGKTGSNPNDLRDEIVQKFKYGLQNMLNLIGPWLPLLALRAGNIESLITGMKASSEDATKILQKIEETKKQVEERLTDTEKTLQAARAAAGKEGAAVFTDKFDEEAKSAEDRNKKWLWATGIFAAGALGRTILFILLGLFGVDEVPANSWEAVYRIGGRVIVISILFSAAVWSGRIALANMHLASVNRHRAVSLQTLQAFHQAAEDSVAKDAVVLEAARAVYENVPSGYIGGRQANEPAGGRTIELIRNANKASQSSGPKGS